ncbi:hypothetical protein PIB30_092242 [Stylosanthes scabra]|uniref:Uncharacterized protein n=1 Tax=Stylosanthes scabra TaxID=79078 RepID=A0ABU6SVJ4_9FABA|nr:hypothetical protein [Stylosanthes scabra]
MGTIKIHRYHFKDEKFTRSVHSRRFDPDHPYEGDPQEGQEKSKTTVDTQPMDASAESDFLRFLMNDTQHVYPSFSSCPSITSRNPDQTSGFSSGTRSIQSGDPFGVWPSSSALSQ